MVTVTRIDRLARSTFDLFAIVKRIVDAGGQFRSLAEPWADTATSTGRLMIAVLGGLADVERDLIRTRTAEGRSRARALGQHMGRGPPFPHPAAAAGSPPAPCGGRDVERPCSLLQRQYGHDFEAQDISAVTLHRIDAARRMSRFYGSTCSPEHARSSHEPQKAKVLQGESCGIATLPPGCTFAPAGEPDGVNHLIAFSGSISTAKALNIHPGLGVIGGTPVES